MNKFLFREEQLIPKDCPHLQIREHTAAESPSQTRERYLVVVTCMNFFVFSLRIILF